MEVGLGVWGVEVIGLLVAFDFNSFETQVA